MKETAFTAIALLVASALPVFAGALLTPITGGPINTDILSVLGLMPLFYCFSLAAGLLFGIPLFLLFRRYHLVRWWSASAAGIVVGSVVALMLRSNAVQAGDFLVLVPEGAVSGLVFWAIWKRGTVAQQTVPERTVGSGAARLPSGR